MLQPKGDGQISKRKPRTERRNLSFLTGQGTCAIMGWTMAGPSIVLTYVAIALNLPVIVAGLLVTTRHLACFGTNIFGSGLAVNIQNRKQAIAVFDCIVAGSYALVVAVVLTGNNTAIIAGLFAAVAIGATVKEFKVLLMTDLLGDNLQPEGRRKIHYTQMLIAGLGVVVLTGFAHWHLRENPPIDHYSAIISIAIICFFGSALLMMAFDDEQPAAVESRSGRRSKGRPILHTFLPDARVLLAQGWFRKFLYLRLLIVSAGLSLPFFSLITALAHSSSSQVLATLIISAAAASIVASRLWRGFNEYSNRLVIVLSATLIAATGFVLLIEYNFNLANSVYLHAGVLFVVTVALKGLTSAQTLHLLEIAPKRQRIACQAVSKSISRAFVIALSFVLATLAHADAFNWIIVLIIAAALAAALTSRLTMKADENVAQLRA
ncbi:hypothetical protein [Hoeflea sp. TYP-13]|uniref:hypothetical protein n=1 Tax=Hoeflea sp. TYP-13 TaxID=3230023 RepID=UPI0034C6DE49